MVSTLRNIPWYFLSAVTVINRVKSIYRLHYDITLHSALLRFDLMAHTVKNFNTQQSVVMIKNMKQIIEKNIHSPTTALESCICIIFSYPLYFINALKSFWHQCSFTITILICMKSSILLTRMFLHQKTNGIQYMYF